MSNHVYTPITLSMNGAKWDSLTPEQQAAVQKAADEAIEWTRQNGETKDGEILKEFEGKIAINTIDAAAFQEASKPVWDKVAEVAGKEFVDSVLAAIGSR